MLKFLLKAISIFTSALIINTATWGQLQRPNIVWITIEDTSPDFIGCYGNTQVKTPNIDALAKDGVRFTNAFSTNTVCSPSRHTIITGVRTTEDGCGNHRSQFNLPSYVKGFAAYLKNAGYFTSNNSKTDYNLANSKAFIQQNWTSQGKNAFFSKRPNRDQPFFSVFNFNESHQSRTVGNSRAWFEKEILSQLKPEEIIQPGNLDMPPFYRNDSDNQWNISRLYNCLQVTDKKVGEIIQMIKDDGDWENTIVFFFADHGQGMPRFKTNSSRLGTQIPFIIRFPEKYQYLINQKSGTTNEELVTFEDLAPTIISLGTGETKPFYLEGRILLGDKKENTDNIYWGSRDNTDEVIDMGRTLIKGDYVYTRIYYPQLAVLQHQAYYDRSDMLKEMRHDYKNKQLDSLQSSIFNPRSPEYLYNRKTDKWETKNLAGDKKYAKLLAEMRQLNQQKMQSYQDVGFLPETIIAQISATDTVLTWKKNHYNFKKYQAVAEMVGMGKQFLTKQLSLLNDPDSVVRYWAVIGLLNQSEKDLDKTTIERSFSNEPGDFVKVEMAELLYAKFHDNKYLDAIADIVIHCPNDYVVRQGAMKLANVENMPDDIIQKIRSAREDVVARHKGDLGYPIRAALGTVLKLSVADDDN